MGEVQERKYVALCWVREYQDVRIIGRGGRHVFLCVVIKLCGVSFEMFEDE